jgi:APA family basic amino acid/polyamine antiporter
MQSEQKLPRRFGLWTAVAVIIGQVIGVGIFLAPGEMAKEVGSPFWILVVWLVAGAMTLSGALCYGELASRFPEAGGSFIYLRKAYGKTAAFLYGWMVMLVLDPGLTAVFAVVLASYASDLASYASGFGLSPAGMKVVAILSVVILGVVNILGARLGTNFLRFLTVLKVATLVFLIGYGFLGGFGSWANLSLTIPEKTDFSLLSFAGGFLGAFFALAGYWEVSRVAEKIENAEKVFPKALTIGVISITILYILTTAVLLYLVPITQVTTDKTLMVNAGQVMFGGLGGAIFAAAIIISLLGTILAYLVVSPWVYYAMAREGLFFQTFGDLHPRFKTPHRASLIQIVAAAVLILLGNVNQIISYFFFVVVLFLGLTVAGLFIFRKQKFDGYKVPFYPITPIFFLILTAVVLVMVGIGHPWESALGVGIVLLGIPACAMFFKNKDRREINGVDKNDTV